MKAVVIRNFYDLQFKTQRTKNEVLEIPKPRCLELIAYGFVEEVPEQKKTKKK